jgi:hypothetical protein
LKRVVAAIMLLVLSACGEVSVPPADAVPEDWKTATSNANHFSFRYPPDWGERGGRSGVWSEADCSDVGQRPGFGFRFWCHFTPRDSRNMWPDSGFDFYVEVGRLDKGMTLEESMAASYEYQSERDPKTASVEQHQESFSGKTWYVRHWVERMPPIVDYGHCFAPDGEIGQNVKRTYVTSIRGRLTLALYFYGCTPEDFDQFAAIADRVVHTVAFDLLIDTIGELEG